MTITTKPKAATVQQEEEIAALINKGGSIATSPPSAELQPATPPPEQEKPVSLRVPVWLLDKLDAELRKSGIKKKRHPWILEAIVEKLERSGALEA